MNRWALIALVIVACSRSQMPTPPGSEGGACYPNATCDSGFICASDVCVNANPCAGVDCSGQGTCVVLANEITCNCDPGYSAVGTACLDTGAGGSGGTGGAIDPDLRLWLECEDAATNGATNSVPGGVQPTCGVGSACPTVVGGAVGSGCSVDGNDYLAIDDTDGKLRFDAGFTLAMWFRMEDLGVSVFFGRPVGVGELNSWSFFVTPDGRLHFEAAPETVTSCIVSTPTATIEPQKWYHATGTWDGAQFCLYLDAAEIDCMPLASVTYDGNEILVAADRNDGIIGEFVTGTIDDVRAYARALTATEVTALVALGASNCPAGMTEHPQLGSCVGRYLEVTTTADSLDGGAGNTDITAAGGLDDLSFREAVEIANSRPGADTIVFNPDLFNPLAPATIVLPIAAQPVTIVDAETAIDATGAGVNIFIGFLDGVPPFAIRAPQFTLRGVTLTNLGAGALHILDAGGAVIDNNVFPSDDGAAPEPVLEIINSPRVEITNNRFILGDVIITANVCDDLVVSGNDFSDIVTGVYISSSLRASVVDNQFDFRSLGRAIELVGGGDSHIARNAIIHPGQECVRLLGGTSGNVVEDNNLFQCSAQAGIHIFDFSQTNMLRRNLMTLPLSSALIRIDPGSNGDQAEPVVLSVGPPISGTAGPNNIIDVFEGSNSMATYLGETTANSTGDWSLDVAATPGGSIVATATDVATGNTSTGSNYLAVP